MQQDIITPWYEALEKETIKTSTTTVALKILQYIAILCGIIDILIICSMIGSFEPSIGNIYTLYWIVISIAIPLIAWILLCELLLRLQKFHLRYVASATYGKKTIST